ILHLSSGQRCPSEEAHGLNHEREAIPFMATKGQDTTKQDIFGVAGWVAVFVDTCAGWQRLVEMGVQKYFTPHERRSPNVKNHRAVRRGEAKANRLRPECWACPTGRDHMWLGTGQVHADQASLDYQFHVVGITPAIVAVIHPNDSKL